MSAEIVQKQSTSNKVVDNAIKELTSLKNQIDTENNEKPIKSAQINEIHELFNCMVTGKGLKLIK